MKRNANSKIKIFKFMDETKMSRYYIFRAATRQEIFYFHAEQWLQNSSEQ